ncbi:hypothetical protein [Dyella terrae]|uniref:hypothetical protein n=1 Tax=Dyella terrae TaxID=522259 RepID=UPI001EFE0139|nr:hypothetical protein [Dyella terrae]ULU25746.1 hypothetical protein DYST_02682 [Dyella terrae]
MSDIPQCLTSDQPFPHKAELMAAIDAGASVRKDERQLMVGRLIGTYEIRLRLAQAQGQPAKDDLALLVDNLRDCENVAVAVWYIHSAGGVRFIVVEGAEDGRFLGCLLGSVENTFPQ